MKQIEEPELTPESSISTSSVEPLPGEFTVNEEGGKVSFSQSNLACDVSGETPKWGFFENQYGYVKKKNASN